MKRTCSVLITLLISILLISCGSGEGGNSLPATRPAGSVTGNAVDALIINGTVKAYSWKSGAVGSVLGSGKTDSKGLFSINVVAPDQPLLVCVTNGYYIEEATGTQVTLKDGQSLCAVTNYTSGEDLDIMVTPFTNLAYAYAQHQIANGMNISNAITSGNTAISSIAGVDILTTYPRNATDPANITGAVTDEHWYGLLTAAISEFTADAADQMGVERHKAHTSIALAQIMYEDVIADGLLDGNGRSGQLAIGNIPLNVNTYRRVIPQSMLGFAASENNATSLLPEELALKANSYASSTHEIYGGAVPLPLDDTGPAIAMAFTEGEYFSGNAKFEFGIGDVVGVASIRFFLDNDDLGNALDLENPSITVNTLLYSNGDHNLRVVARDSLDNVTDLTFLVKFDNEEPVIKMTSPSITNTTNYDLTGTYTDGISGVAKITVNGSLAQLNSDGTFSALVKLAFGKNKISVIATDTIGNDFVTDFTVSVDQIAPTIGIDYGEATFYFEGATYKDVLQNENANPIYLVSDKLSLAGISATPSELKSASIPYFVFYSTDSDPNATGVFTEPGDLIAEIKYERTNANNQYETILDWKEAPEFTRVIGGKEVTLPIVKNLLGDEFYLVSKTVKHRLSIRVSDQAGNAKVVDVTFSVYAVPVQQSIQNQKERTNEFFGGKSFANRAQMYGETIPVTEFKYFNGSGQTLLMKVSSSATHSAVHEHESAVRINQVRLITSTEWRMRGKRLGAGPLGITSLENLTDWVSVDYYADYEKGSWEPVFLPAATIGNAEFVATDTPTPPANTDWSNMSESVGDTFGEYYQIDIGMGSVSYGCHRLDRKFNYGEYSYYAWNANGPADRYGCTNLNSYTPNYSYFQERKTFTYQQVTGYPKIDATSASESKSAGDTYWVVLDSEGSVVPAEQGWYRVPNLATLTIVRYATLPSFDVYSDGTPNYTLANYDVAVEFGFEHTAKFEFALDAGISNASTMPSVSVETSSFSMPYRFER